MKKHFMIDIETTGVNKETDDVLEIGIVPIELDSDGYWTPLWTGDKHNCNSFQELHLVLYSEREPKNAFAKEHMSELYKKCNEVSSANNYEWASLCIKQFIHVNEPGLYGEPQFFMGWNASNFDCEFLIQKGILEPSRYVEINGKEVLQGDVHYRIYEQTGAVNLMLNATGFSKKTIFALGADLLPNNIGVELPKGKKHDALYDCYNQINMMNGLIALAKRGWNLER